MTSTIDFATIARTADLPAILEAEGIAVRSGKFLCPFHDNSRTPAGSLYQRDGGWRFKCHGCEAAGSALDWLMMRDGLTIAEAARRLSGEPGPERAARPRPPRLSTPAGARPSVWPNPEWQGATAVLVALAETTLWSVVGGDALEWLHRRGLDDLTIRRFRLGFVPGPVESDPLACLGGQPIRARRGITIPWAAPESWYTLFRDPEDPEDIGPRFCGVNVRRLADDVHEPWQGGDKCRAFAGSSRGLGYPWPEFLPSQTSRPALIVEGEFDALIAEQELGDRVNVVTFGGSSQTPEPWTLATVRRCPQWLIATDHDQAGNDAARRIHALNPLGSRRLYLPTGTDLTDYVRAGGDLRSWLAKELKRLGIG